VKSAGSAGTVVGTTSGRADAGPFMWSRATRAADSTATGCSANAMANGAEVAG
jgi:hypothetical protein